MPLIDAGQAPHEVDGATEIDARDVETGAAVTIAIDRYVLAYYGDERPALQQPDWRAMIVSVASRLYDEEDEAKMTPRIGGVLITIDAEVMDLSG